MGVWVSLASARVIRTEDETHEARKDALREQGFRDDDLARIRAPIGLDIGGQTPEETAVAILAEMLAVRHGKRGGALALVETSTASGESGHAGN